MAGHKVLAAGIQSGSLTSLSVLPMHRPLVTRAGFGPSWLRRHRTRLWDTLRMTAAAAVTFALGATLGLSQSFWAVIAAVVATQSSLGGTLKASFEQFIGSVFGAGWGAAITLAIPHFGEEAARERRTSLANEPDPEPLSRTLARLHTDISTLGRILTKPLPEAVHRCLAEPWSRVARATAQVLRHTSLALPARRSPPT